MDSVSGIVSDMTGCILYSNEMSSRMLSKYEESMTNINDIEKTVEALMCELGIGGFMGVEDIMPGMKVQITMDGASAEVYHGLRLEMYYIYGKMRKLFRQLHKIHIYLRYS